MTKLSLEEQEVLLSVHELSPLWEIAYSLAKRLGRSVDAEVRERAANHLRRLAERGWLELQRDRVIGAEIEGNPVVVPITELETVLENDLNWVVPRDRHEQAFDHYIFATTDSGEAAIDAGAVDDVWPS